MRPIDRWGVSGKTPCSAGVAQLVEHPICNRAVGSSSLSTSTIPTSNHVPTRCNRSIVVVSMKVWVDHFSTYIYQKRGFFYFSRRVPKDVQPLHGKQSIVLALNTRSRAKALKHSQVICQRLDERWLPMRLDAVTIPILVTLSTD